MVSSTEEKIGRMTCDANHAVAHPPYRLHLHNRIAAVGAVGMLLAGSDARSGWHREDVWLGLALLEVAGESFLGLPLRLPIVRVAAAMRTAKVSIPPARHRGYSSKAIQSSATRSASVGFHSHPKVSG
jgi:hypothetical protein